ncbi:hypothetical protein ALQ16_202809 [Pseudomonas syringae pv. actinidiae]|nr:hypothetical protein ALQ16_202809 [Pseudomonas syringae pv. actinidiae]
MVAPLLAPAVLATPRVMITPSSVAVTPELTRMTLVRFCPSSVTSATPSLFRSPSMVMFLLTTIWLCSATVMPVEKVTISPFWALVSASRKLPVPVLLVEVTVKVASPHW